MSEDDKTGPEPTRWLTYNGDRRNMRNLVGPDTVGDYLLPVEAEYDEVADRTRVGFVIAPGPVT